MCKQKTMAYSCGPSKVECMTNRGLIYKRVCRKGMRAWKWPTQNNSGLLTCSYALLQESNDPRKAGPHLSLLGGQNHEINHFNTTCFSVTRYVKMKFLIKLALDKAIWKFVGISMLTCPHSALLLKALQLTHLKLWANVTTFNMVESGCDHILPRITFASKNCH